MRRNCFILLLILIFLICFSFFSSFSQTVRAQEKNDLPEEEGIYDVPGNKKLKLRVFIYHSAKQSARAKPTPTPPALPSCGLPDPDSLNEDGTTGWHLKNNSITYRLNKSSVPVSVGSSNFSLLTKNSFDAWVLTTNIATSSISFNEGATTIKNKASFDSQNIITWGRTSASALAVTYTWYNSFSGEVVETDTVFNNNYPWKWSGSNVCAYSGYYDAQNILTHELGHWFGINDEYTDPFIDNTMYGYGSKNEVKKNTLTIGDIAAINKIYPN